VGEKTEEKIQKFNSYLLPFLSQGLTVQVVFKLGNPVDVILKATQEEAVDLLIIGALQKENLVNYYIGSIARKITRKATCDVLLLIKPSVERNRCNKIIVNGLKHKKTQHAIEAACFFSAKLGASKMTIVEEIQEEEISIKVDDKATLRKAAIAREKITRREDKRVHELLSTIPEHLKENYSILTQPIFGQRGYSIGHYAETVRADLLVMNAPSKTTIWDRIFPHDLEHILSELPTDVLIIQ